MDYINSILNTWGTPIKRLGIGLATLIATAGGVGPYIIRMIGKRRNKENNNKENEKRKGDNGNNMSSSPVRSR